MSNENDTHLRSDRRGYDPPTETYHAEHDWADSDSVCYAVLTAVAAVTGSEPHAVSPLGDIVDPDALSGLFGPQQEAGSPNDHVTLTVAECEVTVYRDGHIVVRPPDPD